MRKLIYIADKSCNACKHYLQATISPLMSLFPGQIDVHVGFDRKVAEVDARQVITSVPTVVIEEDGEEVFRFSGMLSSEDLEAILRGDA